MRRIGLCFCIAVAACGSSSDDGPAGPDDTIPDAAAGAAGVFDAGRGSGGAGGPQTDSGSAGRGTTGGSVGAGGHLGSGGSSGGTVGTGGSPATGGSLGGGGHGGATDGGGGTVTPGTCAALPVPGTWENIGPDAVNRLCVATPELCDGNNAGHGKGASEALVVDPFDPATVWLTVGYSGLHKSKDCGATWAHVNTGRNGDAIDAGNHVSMAVDPVDQGTIYLISIFDGLGFWKSTNGGVDWDQMFAPGSDVTAATNNNADGISMDPTDHKHIVVNFHTNCLGAYAPTCGAETKDGGTTWHLFKTPNANWEEGAGAWVLGANSWLYAGLELYLTEDSGGTWKKVTPMGTWGFSGGEVATHMIPRASDGTYLLTSSQSLVSSSDGRTWAVVPGLAHRTVGFAMGKDNFFASDQWSNAYYSATGGDWRNWSTLPPPDGTAGAPYLDYDASHHILYSSNFSGGFWRLVTQ